ncbi:MAG: DUF4168 domain-containing protein [Stigonema ocellatum SAG 48.90 = DSM 106950]|nr:DUF4168 domain-containing protein [Stigonema ocellatum SAG 48.90 = DSM 106950]
MLKPLLTGSYVFVLLLAGSLSAQAQVPQPPSSSSQPQAPTAPQGNPSSQPRVPTAPQGNPSSQPQAQISPDELQKFARSLKQLLAIEKGLNQEMAQVVSKSGMSQERFSEIYQAQKNPSTQPKTAITSQEKQQFQKTFTKLGEIQQKGQSKMEQVVKKEGLDPARFNQILVTVRQDPTLLQKVRQMIQS